MSFSSRRGMETPSVGRLSDLRMRRRWEWKEGDRRKEVLIECINGRLELRYFAEVQVIME